MATQTKQRFNPQKTAKQIAADIIDMHWSNKDLAEDYGLNEKQLESVVKQFDKIVARLRK